MDPCLARFKSELEYCSVTMHGYDCPGGGYCGTPSSPGYGGGGDCGYAGGGSGGFIGTTA